MIPPTKNGLPSMACLSAVQKCIRRSLEREAMEFAVELIHTSRAFHTMVWNRLRIICHEDLDVVAAPWLVPFVEAAATQADALYRKAETKAKAKGVAINPGGARMVLANTIRLMCAAPKSRVGDHFQAAVGLRELLEGFAPEIPDWANDGHTLAGKRMGRGLDYFREQSTKLVNSDGSEVPEDEYADEAYRLWRLKTGKGAEVPEDGAEDGAGDSAGRRGRSGRTRGGRRAAAGAGGRKAAGAAEDGAGGQGGLF